VWSVSVCVCVVCVCAAARYMGFKQAQVDYYNWYISMLKKQYHQVLEKQHQYEVDKINAAKKVCVCVPCNTVVAAVVVCVSCEGVGVRHRMSC